MIALERDKRTIKVMPDKETLEAFLESMSGPVKVSFNIEEGKFDWLEKRDVNLGQPKTEEGYRLREL